MTWCLPFGLLFPVLVHLVGAGLAVGVFRAFISTPGGQVVFADWGRASPTSYAYLMSLPVVLAFHLRSLLAAEGMAQSRAHALWQIRVFHGLILPLTAVVIVAALLVLAITPAQACALALSAVACGAWLVIAPVRVFTVMTCHGALCHWVAPHIPHFAEWWPVVQSGFACFAWWLLWRHLQRSGWEDLQLRQSIWMTRVNEWCDRHVMMGGRMVRAPARGLPGIGAALGLKDQLSGSGVVLWLVTLLIIAIPIHYAAREAQDMTAVLVMTFLVVAFVAIGCSVGWISAIEYPRQGAAGGGIRDFLAVERLRPWSNRRGAAALLLALCLPVLAQTMTFALALLVSLAAAAPFLAQGATQELWLLIPFTLGSAVAAGAASMLMALLPGWIGRTGLFSLFIVPLGVLLAFGAWRGECLPWMTGCIWLVALLLLPLAWRRLATCELP